MDKDLLEQQSKAYQVPGVDESEDTKEKAKSKKRKKPDSGQDGKPKKEFQNTAVYVTSLPLDATKEEIEEVFSRYGLIAESIDTEDKRVKMYTDDDGNFTGEALVIYYRPESVQLAINMLDDTDFNFRQGPNGKMKVQEADVSFKKHKAEDEGEKKEPKKQSRVDKETKQRYEKRQAQKLADWGDEGDIEPSKQPGANNPKLARTLVLKHMFTLHELEEDPEAENDIKEDIMEESLKFGEVEVVYVFNMEVAGVAVVRFAEPSSALKCAKAFNGRQFDGRSVVAYIADGTERFKRTKKDQHAEEERRIARFAKELESGALAKDFDDDGQRIDNNGQNNGDE